MKIRLRILTAIFLILYFFCNSAYSQIKDSVITKSKKVNVDTLAFPVSYKGEVIFDIYGKLGPYSPEDRAASIVSRLEKLDDDRNLNIELLEVYNDDGIYDIRYMDRIIMTVTKSDAVGLKMTQELAADNYLNYLKRTLNEGHKKENLKQIIMEIGMVLLVLLILFLAVKFLNKGFKWITDNIDFNSSKYIKGISIKNYELLSAEREEQLLLWLINVIKWIAIIIILYLSLPIVFSIFPTTEGVANQLFGYVLTPLKIGGGKFISFIPNLITITIIVVISRYIVRFLDFLSTEIKIGKLQIPGFYTDWAKPTFNIVRLIIYAFSFIMIFPYLPGSDSPVFQGVSVFLGVLLSLGSSSAIGNIVAGLVLTYMRAFKVGERVKIGGVSGDVIEKTMLVTRLRTIKNEDVTIPNSSILNGSTINYSSSAKNLGLILNTTVTIGYDVPWKKVHELLIEAALKTELVKKTPTPFVLQTSLDDFYVSYQLNAYTERADAMARIYSELHSHIQDNFNREEIEIMSPHYRAERDGNKITIPTDYIPPQ